MVKSPKFGFKMDVTNLENRPFPDTLKISVTAILENFDQKNRFICDVQLFFSHQRKKYIRSKYLKNTFESNDRIEPKFLYWRQHQNKIYLFIYIAEKYIIMYI